MSSKETKIWLCNIRKGNNFKNKVLFLPKGLKTEFVEDIKTHFKCLSPWNLILMFWSPKYFKIQLCMFYALLYHI